VVQFQTVPLPVSGALACYRWSPGVQRSARAAATIAAAARRRKRSIRHRDGFARANNGYEIIGVANASTNSTSRVAGDAGAQVVPILGGSVTLGGRPSGGSDDFAGGVRKKAW